MIFRKINLAGSRIIITGASTGIGAALAKVLADHSARLILAARSEDKLQQLAASLSQQQGEAVAVPTDITNAQARQRLIEEACHHYGGIDMLINNAGVGASGPFVEVGESVLRQVFEINFFAATELTRLAIPHLKAGINPMIVNIASVIGRRAVPGYAEYCASKFAMCGWSEALRGELKALGIHVLLVCPGLIATPFPDHMMTEDLDSGTEKYRKMSAEQCARIIVKAIRKKKREVIITGGAKMLLWLNHWFPGFTDSLLTRYMSKHLSTSHVDASQD